ncbi:hypothetical protein BYT27DRAFT_7250354 [Phlegmacium glaucopus]|nr:hypothetical protein BYT27DRAFT_7250354 [Phlegmacium glaucopus]
MARLRFSFPYATLLLLIVAVECLPPSVLQPYMSFVDSPGQLRHELYMGIGFS